MRRMERALYIGEKVLYYGREGLLFAGKLACGIRCYMRVRLGAKFWLEQLVTRDFGQKKMR